MTPFQPFFFRGTIGWSKKASRERHAHIEEIKSITNAEQSRMKAKKFQTFFSLVASDCDPDNAIAINIVSFAKLKQSAKSFIIELSMTINFLEVLANVAFYVSSVINLL